MTSFDIAIIGGGIFGCAIARSLSERCDLDICVVEKEYHLAKHQSGRNSGTLHLGVVTEADVVPGTQLAEFTIDGARRLKSYCREHDLPLLDRGIMKVGRNPHENRKVEQMYESARQSGVDAELLESEAEIREREPHISGKTALFSQESATVDTVAITNHLANAAWNNGVEFLMGWKVTDLEKNRTGVHVETNKRTIEADYVVNAAGARAVRFGDALGYGRQYQAVPFRGLYYELVPEKRSLVNSNVYPTTIGPSFQVGVHFTRRPDNRVIVGPTGMIALGTETYGKAEFNLSEVAGTLKSSNFRKFIGNGETLKLAWDELNKTYRKKTFLERCQKLIPSLQSDDLVEGYVGISHWLFDSDGERVNDPVIEFGEESAHLLLPQPGFTSALPIADHITEGVLSRTT